MLYDIRTDIRYILSKIIYSFEIAKTVGGNITKFQFGLIMARELYKIHLIIFFAKVISSASPIFHSTTYVVYCIQL